MSIPVTAVLVAAGSSLRFVQAEESTPKQFLDFRGQPLFMWPLEILASHPRIDVTIVVTMPERVAEVTEIVRAAKISENVEVTAGGATRQESVWCGLQALINQVSPDSLVLVHDAARPFLTSEIVDATIAGAEESGACTVAIPLADTIKRVNDGIIESTLERDRLMSVQTPQVVRFDWLLESHEQARQKGLTGSDDAALLEAAGHKVKVVPGSSYNLKVTHRDDLILAEALAQILF